MGTYANIVSLAFGVVLGGLVFARVILWIGMCGQFLVDGRSWQFVLATSLFHSGPWLLALVAEFAYYEYPETWARWFLAGLVGAVALQSIPVITNLRHLKQIINESRNAA